jgi:long-chain acyl-CoA synthetase
MKPNTQRLFERIGYPSQWLAEAERYGVDDAYVAFDPDWAEEIPPIPRQTVDFMRRIGLSSSPSHGWVPRTAA